MKRFWLVLLGLAAALPMVIAAVSAQESTPEGSTDVQQGQEEQQEGSGQMAMVRLQEMDGFSGIAVMRGTDSQTEVVAGLLPTGGGFLGLGGPDPSSLGELALISGTCEEPQGVEETIAQVMPHAQQQEEEEANVWVANGSVNMSLDDLLSGQYSLGVLSAEDMQATPEGGLTGTPEGGQDVSEQLIACGALEQGAMVQMDGPLPGLDEDALELTPSPSPSPSF